MSNEEEQSENGKGLMEAFLGEAASKSPSLEASTESPPAVSFEKSNQGEVKLTIPYMRINYVRYEAAEIRLEIGERFIRLTGVYLDEIYEALLAQRALRIIEQPEFSGDEDDPPEVAYVDNIWWEREFD